MAALAAVPLKFLQLAINSLVEGGDVWRLSWLCAGFFLAVLLSAGVKFLLGLRLAVVGERVVPTELHQRRVEIRAGVGLGEVPDAAREQVELVAPTDASVMILGGVRRIASSLPVERKLVSCLDFIGLTSRSSGLAFSPMSMPS